MGKGAVFLDRDGVLIKEYGYIKEVNELPFFSYTQDCVKRIHEAGMLAIVITNQSGVARGLFSEEELIKANRILIDRLSVDEVYYCPHHPEGKIKKYSIVCNCRKPKTGLIEQACFDFNIDLNKSFFIGDRESDIQTGVNAGVKTILVRTGYGAKEKMKNVIPDYICNDLNEAVDICINGRG